MAHSDTAEVQADLGALLLDRGLITPAQLDEAIKIQRTYEVSGRDPLPRLGEILIERGFVGERDISEALAAQNKVILHCPRCDIQVNVQNRPDAQGYKCSRCEGILEKPSRVRHVRVVDSSIILISKEPVPDEVRETMRDPARKFGKYVLMGEIGRGGAAIIHRAWDTYLNQFVALKFLKAASGTQGGGSPRSKNESRILDLMKEARSAARLRHPGIVTVHEVGKVDHEFYIAMELLEGAPMSDLVRRAREQGKVSPFYDEPRRFLMFVRDIARAVHHAHTRPTPLVHCDLKPSNVFITKAGRACVLDFGLAREIKADSADEAGLVRGTPAYMAPEQAAGRPEDIDARTDVYGLGGILYELLAGRPPFTGDLFNVLHKAISSMPDRPSDIFARTANGTVQRSFSVPAVLEKMCLRCLEKDRSSRYASGKDFADDLDRLIRGEPLIRGTTRRTVADVDAIARRAGTPERKLARPARLALVAAAVFAVAFAAFSAAIGMSSRGARKTQEELLAIRRDADRLVASLRTADARKLYDEAAKAAGPAAADWIDADRVELDWLDRLKASLAGIINLSRHRCAVFKLSGAELRDVEVLKATHDKVVLFAEGKTVEAPWETIAPAQLYELFQALLGDNAAAGDRFGLALFCMKNRMKPEAKRIFEALKSTDLGPFARRYLAKLTDSKD